MQSDPRIDFVLSRLERVRKTQTGWIARCPAHPDHTPSLSVGLGRSAIVLHCFAGCEPEEVVLKLGLKWKDLFYENQRREQEPLKPRFDSDMRRTIALEAAACCARLQEEPEVLQRLYEARSWTPEVLKALGVGWTGRRLTWLAVDSGGQPHDILLYNPFHGGSGPYRGVKILAGRNRSRQPWPAPESLKHPRRRVWLVEGESTAISLATLGLQVVGLPGGISKPSYDPLEPGRWRGPGWHPSWAARFKGSNFVLVPDCDPTGRALMLAVEYDLSRRVGNCVYADLSPENTAGFDLGDWMRPIKTEQQRTTAKELLDMFVRTMMLQPEQADEARAVLKSFYSWCANERSAVA